MTVDLELESHCMNGGSAPTGEFQIVPFKQLDDFAWPREIGEAEYAVVGSWGLPQIFNQPLHFHFFTAENGTLRMQWIFVGLGYIAFIKPNL